MRWSHTRRSERDYRAAPSAIQDAFDKLARLLVADPHHPLLLVKKYKGAGIAHPPRRGVSSEGVLAPAAAHLDGVKHRFGDAVGDFLVAEIEEHTSGAEVANIQPVEIGR